MEIISAIITGGLALIGTIIGYIATTKKNEHNLQINQAITNTKMDELTREVREHNGFAKRMPVLEEKIETLNTRVKDLENLHKGGN